jgi:hypothetical protein
MMNQQQQQMMPQQPEMMPQPQIENGTVSSWIYVDSRSVEVDKSKGVFWNPLGPGQICEIDNCRAPAYQTCTKDVPFYGNKKFFKGCGKKMCMAHCSLVMNSSDGIPPFLAGWHCKESECEKAYKHGKKVECCYIAVFMSIISTLAFGGFLAFVFNDMADKRTAKTA